MTVFLSNRDGNGKTNEEGHYKFQTFFYDGNVSTSEALKVTQNSPLGLSVLVAVGQFKIDTTTYSYTGWIDASTPVTISAANVSNPRIDVIVIYVDKQATTSASPPNNPGIAKLLAVSGTASASPTAPNGTTIQAAVGSGNPYTILANVNVGTAATQVTNSNITDLREPVKLSEELLSPQSLLASVGPLLYPVGSIYTNATDATNPGTLLGFGTWSRFGQGRVLVSIDTGDTDFGGVGQTGGDKTVTLTEAQMPNHSHVVDPPATGTSTNGNHNHRVIIYNGNNGNRGGGDISGANWPSNQNANNPTTDAGNHAHTVDIPAFNSGSKGNGQSHSNMQPYVTVYMWRRTA